MYQLVDPEDLDGGERVHQQALDEAATESPRNERRALDDVVVGEQPRVVECPESGPQASVRGIQPSKEGVPRPLRGSRNSAACSGVNWIGIRTMPSSWPG